MKGATNFKLTSDNTRLCSGARLSGLATMEPELRDFINNNQITLRHEGNGVGSSAGVFFKKNIRLIMPHANKYAGKALSGGEIYIEGVATNYAFYGASSGYFGVRHLDARCGNRLSGADVITETVGPLGFQNMTSGSLTILGANTKWYLQA